MCHCRSTSSDWIWYGAIYWMPDTARNKTLLLEAIMDKAAIVLTRHMSISLG